MGNQGQQFGFSCNSGKIVRFWSIIFMEFYMFFLKVRVNLWKISAETFYGAVAFSFIISELLSLSVFAILSVFSKIPLIFFQNFKINCFQWKVFIVASKIVLISKAVVRPWQFWIIFWIILIIRKKLNGVLVCSFIWKHCAKKLERRLHTTVFWSHCTDFSQNLNQMLQISGANKWQGLNQEFF